MGESSRDACEWVWRVYERGWVTWYPRSRELNSSWDDDLFQVFVSMMFLAVLLLIVHRHDLTTWKRNPCVRVLVYSKWHRHVHQLDMPSLTRRNHALGRLWISLAWFAEQYPDSEFALVLCVSFTENCITRLLQLLQESDLSCASWFYIICYQTKSFICTLTLRTIYTLPSFSLAVCLNCKCKTRTAKLPAELSKHHKYSFSMIQWSHCPLNFFYCCRYTETPVLEDHCT